MKNCALRNWFGVEALVMAGTAKVDDKVVKVILLGDSAVGKSK